MLRQAQHEDDYKVSDTTGLALEILMLSLSKHEDFTRHRNLVMRLAAAIALSTLIATSTPALAADDPVSGVWTVHGKVSAFSFELTCHFERKGETIGGTCYDGGTNKPHPLTQGAIIGDRISWTYQSSYLFNKFDASYSGLMSGTSIKGEITAPGYRGNFTAEKQP